MIKPSISIANVDADANADKANNAGISTANVDIDKVADNLIQA